MIKSSNHDNRSGSYCISTHMCTRVMLLLGGIWSVKLEVRSVWKCVVLLSGTQVCGSACACCCYYRVAFGV